jgi:hypothetical protein
LSLGYLPQQETVSALQADNGNWRALAEPKASYRYCANATHGVCNWLVRADSDDQFCVACRHNRTIPDLSVPLNLANWRKIETAKHRLFYTLLKLRLPLPTKADDPEGLAFDFLANPSGGSHLTAPVMTGHANGLITINLAEADDPERERQRKEMGEPYRTLLGHFRHEIAHFYWDRLVANSPALDRFRDVFGDEQQDYQGALQRYYSEGPAADWPEHFVSAYASMHPWEDFAETWAHFFHMIDTLETASAFGLRVRPKVAIDANLATEINFNPHIASMERIIDAWLPLAFAANSINRSMGLHDLYPFVLRLPVIVKLTFVHECIHPARGAGGTLRAALKRLKRAVGAPA